MSSLKGSLVLLTKDDIYCSPMTSQQIKNLFACRVLTSLLNAATAVVQMYKIDHPTIIYIILATNKQFNESLRNVCLSFLFLYIVISKKKGWPIKLSPTFIVRFLFILPAELSKNYFNILCYSISTHIYKVCSQITLFIKPFSF